MNIFEDTNPRQLKELVGQIHSREAALPDFQRDFVWDPSATQELISSIAASYPAGSLLRIRDKGNLFACREFAGAPPLHGAQPTFLVLDGQQRLTSLYQAFYGVGDHQYFIKVRDLIGGADFEDCIVHFRINSRIAHQFNDFAVQSKDLIMPLSVLKSGYGGFLDWMLKVAEAADSDKERLRIQKDLQAIGEQWIKPIDGYTFPVVTLVDSTSAAAVCTIFETLNRTGVKLSVFELLTARFWPQNIKLRDLWEKTKKDYPIIADFGVDPYYLLQIVSLVSRAAPSCKRSDVLDLKPSALTGWWDRAVAALAKSLEILREDCGVLIPNWLPYDTLLIPLAGVLARTGTLKGPQAAAARQKLAQWFWCSTFGQVYDNAANSQAAVDLTELLGWIAEGAAPRSIANFSFDPEILKNITPRQRAQYRAAMCLIVSLGSRDFHSAAKLSGSLIQQNGVDDHHVFPQAWLKKEGISGPVVDSILNRTLIDSSTNKSINDRPPSKYMKEVRASIGEKKFAELLKSHLLPHDPDGALLKDKFEEFTAWRKDAIWNEIKAHTGVQDKQQI
ncbi:MAG: DUF262 domain-containing protein [Candidatus Binatus sp.]|uniref:GmrSD restriction endonuclease domain-containing protein n=1 Tax=Candidatus Binatus sp. TaxID=2811406 RepID=UPI00271BC964|nr:DUF262 domain-containing protein [Candidatus Binatus sp.]MDO8432081.1 DUF262 domain-containing protein [Candidatus Binatus sp.]